MLRSRFVLLGAVLAAVAAGSAQACPDHTAKTAASVTRRPASAAALVAWKPRVWTPVAANGMQVSIDPVDGAYGMPAADDTPPATIAREEAPVAVTRRMDGSVRAQLDERFADFAVVTLGADGKPRWTCVHGSSLADKFMRAPAPVATPAPAPQWEEK